MKPMHPARFTLMASLALAGFVIAGPAARVAHAQPRLLTLSLIATDAQGRPVTDLAPADLQLTDQSKPLPLLTFRNDALRPPPAPLAPREFTNRPAPALTRIRVVLFDVLNLNTEMRQSKIDQIVKVLEPQEKSESIYCYVLNLRGELVPVRALPSTASSAAAPAPEQWTRGIRPLLERAVGPVAAIVPVEVRAQSTRVERTFAALEILAGRLAPLPGRKDILWITFGVPSSLLTPDGQPFDCFPNLRKVASKLADAGAVVDPLNQLASSGDTTNLATLEEFAAVTGGRVYQGADVERDLPTALESGQSLYRLQYAPPAESWDGKLHKLHLATTRKGVTLQTRQSYLAEKPAPLPAEKDRALALLQQPLDRGAIALRVTTTPGVQPHALHLSISVDPQDLLLTQQDDKTIAQFTFYFAAYLSAGKPQDNDKLQTYDAIPVNLSLTAPQRDKVLRDGLRLGNDLTVPDAATRLRVVILDRASGATASVTIPLV